MNLGEYQELYCVKKVDFGIYLAESKNSVEHVLLPAKQVPENVKLGDKLRVFLYKDSKDRLIATTHEPKLVMGQLSVLQVKEITKIGAFLDWGLEKDLFLPYKEMTEHPHIHDEILVSLYIDKSERLCATMRGIYHMLRTDSPYHKDDMVTGRVYEFSENFGAFVAVDDCYSARIPVFEDHSTLHIGEVIEAKVTGVKEDGKLDLTLRERAYIQMDADAEKIMALLESYAGVLPFTEKASPEVIARETGLSKNAFKRAVGHLYKERKVDLADGKIRKAAGHTMKKKEG
jgi:predicted RNA-binding protein (virulence factor B family)